MDQGGYRKNIVFRFQKIKMVRVKAVKVGNDKQRQYTHS